MSVGIGESKIDERIEFRWGKKRGRGGAKKDVQFYESFEFDGVEYSLYDSVYLFKHGETDPYIGKLIKIWEQPVNDKKIKVLWFFRPSEISDHLQGVDVLENELFLGDGVGTGLTNINPLEAIAGKCNVVCVSKDSRNRQPSVEELEMADFIFYRTFDVKSLTISDKLEEKIAMVDVEMLLNKNVCGPTDLAKLDNVSAASDAAKAPISAEDALVTSNLAKLDNENVAVDAAKLDAVSDKTVLVAGVKREKILDKDTRETGDAAKTKQVLESGRKSSLKSPALKKTDLGKVGEGAVAVTTIENGKSVTVSDVKKQIVAGGNKSKDRLSNKSLPANDVRKTIDCDGTSTRKFGNASAASNKVAEPAGRAAATIKEEKLNEEAVGIRDTAPRKQKCDSLLDEKSSDKSYIASLGKAPKRPSEAAESNDTRKLSREHDGTSEGFSKKRKSANLIEHKSNDKMGKVSVKRPNDSRIEANNEVKQVTQRPPDTSKWFTASSWEDRMKFAYDEERLILLQNLDPTYSASEVENIVSHGFGENCTVKIVERTATSSPHSGQALAIFNTRGVAAKITTKLETGCLMLPNGRPLVGTTRIMNWPGKQSPFFGHLVLEKSKQQKQKEMKDAVSTSHSAQPNTIEYEMALEWRLLQDRSGLCWKLLYQKQAEEVKKLKASLKSK